MSLSFKYGTISNRESVFIVLKIRGMAYNNCTTEKDDSIQIIIR